MSYVVCHMSYVMCHMSVICHMTYVIWHMSYVICHMSYVICNMSYVICHGHTFQSTPVQSTPVQCSPVQSSPGQSSPVESSPVPSSPVHNLWYNPFAILTDLDSTMPQPLTRQAPAASCKSNCKSHNLEDCRLRSTAGTQAWMHHLSVVTIILPSRRRALM